MIKGLEALCYLDDIANGRKMNLDPHKLKLIVEKELKALEIIKGKRIDIADLFDTFMFKNGLEHYNSYRCDENRKLTQEEYELLKEVLE